MNIGKFSPLPLCSLIGNVRVYILDIVSLVVILRNWVCDNWVYQFPKRGHVKKRQKVSRLERGEKTPTPKISALVRKRPVLLRANSVLTKDRNFRNGLITDIFVVKCTGRGLVVKRPGVLSKAQMLNLVLGVGVFSLLSKKKDLRHPSIIFARHQFSGPFWRALSLAGEKMALTEMNFSAILFVALAGISGKSLGVLTEYHPNRNNGRRV